MYPVFVFCILVSPALTAFPSQTVGVGPDGVTKDPNEPHYVMINVTKPELPHHGSPADDCAGDPRPASPVDTATSLASPILANPPDPMTIGSVEPYFPRCVAVPLLGCATPLTCSSLEAYASYDFTTGRYYLEADIAIGVVQGTRPNDVILTGTTGVDVTTDCLGCPPWKDGG